LVLTFVLILIKLVILFSIAGYAMNVQQLAIKTIYDFVSLTFDIFIVALFVQAILSWVNPDPYHPVSSLLRSLTFPILNPIRKFMPPMGGIDLSTLVGLIGLMFIKRLVLSIFQIL
jgi:YggT family protein